MSIRRAAGAALVSLPLLAHATNGLFEHGYGIKSLGFGGISYVADEETTTISANPAAAIALGSRYDLGADVLLIKAHATMSGNAAGPDRGYSSNGRHFFPIPQGGFTMPLAPHWAVGVTAFAAGFGPDYEQSPYARFAAPSQLPQAASSTVQLKISGLSLVLANEVFRGQSLGFALNVQHETLFVRGLAPFAAFSETPDAVTDTGKHGAWGIGFTLGWSGALASWLDGGLSYRSKSWTQPITEYRGLLPDHGRIELPPIFGGGLLVKPAADWRIGLEVQRYQYSAVHSFSNPIDLLYSGRPLGSSDGPGFGWNDQTVYKIATDWKPIPRLTLRAGFQYSTHLIPRSQTLFNLLAPGTPRLHYTAGATFTIDRKSEVSGYAGMTPHEEVRGDHSIPAAFGGGEAAIDFRGILLGISLGHRFGSGT